MAKKGKGEGGGASSGGRGLGGQLLLVGAVLFAVSWFVPVYRGQDVFGALPGFAASLGISPEGALQSLSGPDWLPGWSACKFAWHLLNTDESLGRDSERWKQYLLGATCLTNAAMGIALLMALSRGFRGGAALGAGLLLLACAGVDAAWIYLLEQDPLDVYRPGYFVWLGSFVVVGLGALANVGKR
jgi:hypothetical protein